MCLTKDNRYIPIKLKTSTCSLIEYSVQNPEAYTVRLETNCQCDTLIIHWKITVVTESGVPIKLPSVVTIPIGDRTAVRLMYKKNPEAILMTRQGGNWYNVHEKKITKNTSLNSIVETV